MRHLLITRMKFGVYVFHSRIFHFRSDQERIVDMKLKHPKYKHYESGYDIALLRLGGLDGQYAHCLSRAFVPCAFVPGKIDLADIFSPQGSSQV